MTYYLFQALLQALILGSVNCITPTFLHKVAANFGIFTAIFTLLIKLIQSGHSKHQIRIKLSIFMQKLFVTFSSIELMKNNSPELWDME